jgi:hypothetical protein
LNKGAPAFMVAASQLKGIGNLPGVLNVLRSVARTAFSATY